ncbi:M20/M25/M40 family metallo-hydrolase [Lacrimispora sp. 210928-DFI.3.58]|uniref:M20/M25/M40 family metallo-hydrolase n=1 Tax=Lacrimispora sp. 210928-DFI.3.58 TaxID=2883214 RepID=UPI0015B5D842|nr:M20/M25/M40 family metallo-hydrolase [Lacrimispora sp. 210928-DFI.3.58]
MKKIFDYIEAHHDAYLEELFTFLRCKSISTRDEGVEECAQMLSDIMEKSGISTTIYPTSRHPVVYGERIENEDLPTMLIYGHYDVQPPEPLEEWNSDPFEPVIRDGRIFCRGASDNKAQLYTHVKAAEAWLQVEGKLPVNVKYLFEGEEEIGSPDLLPFVEEHKDLLKCDVCFYSDSHYHENGRPQINLGVKGLCYVEITLREAETDLHSMMATCIQNPAWRMVQLLSTLKDPKGNITIDGFYDDVRPLNKLEIEAAGRIPSDEETLKSQYGVKRFLKGRRSDDFYYNLIFEPTCNIAGLYAGFTGDGSKTVLPKKASVKIDMRLVPDQKPEKILEALKDHLCRHGFSDAEIRHYGMVTPSRTPVDHPYVKVAEEALREGFLQEPIVFPGIGGVAPDYVFTGHLGVPTIVIPYAAADQKNHAPNESMVLDGFFHGIRTSAALVYHLAKEAGEYE